MYAGQQQVGHGSRWGWVRAVVAWLACLHPAARSAALLGCHAMAPQCGVPSLPPITLSLLCSKLVRLVPSLPHNPSCINDEAIDELLQ